MSNREDTDVLVLEECRYPYILQTVELYRFVRLAWYIAVIIVYSFTFLYYCKLRNLPRLTVRPLSLVFMIYFLFMLDATTVHLNEALGDAPNFLNSCAVQSFSLFFISYGLLVVMGLSLFLYYMKYKVYKSLLKSTESTTSATATGLDTVELNTHNKTLQLYSYTTDVFAAKACILLCVLGVVVFSFTTYMFCPELNPDNFNCPNENNNSPDFFVYIGIGILLLALLIFVIFSTFKYPDPFGIIREVLLVSIIYVLQVISFNTLSSVLPQFSTGNMYYITPYFAISLLGLLMFIIVAPMQIYFAKTQKKVTEMTIEEILNNSDLIKLFRVQVESQNATELLNFYVAVKKYKSVFETSSETSIFMANDILDRFVLAGAKEQINVSHEARELIAAKFKDNRNIPEEIFDKLVEESVYLLNTNCYYNFINGALYRLYLGLKPVTTDSLLSDGTFSSI